MAYRVAIVAVSVLLLAGCSPTRDGPGRPVSPSWFPGISAVDTREEDEGSVNIAQLRVTNVLAGAGTMMVVGGAVMLAIPGLRQWGGTTALSGIALAWLAIAFGHPLIPLAGFVFLVALAVYKVYRYRHKIIRNQKAFDVG